MSNIKWCAHFYFLFGHRRASAYDVFAPSVLNSAAGMSGGGGGGGGGGGNQSRRSSFRATGQEQNMYKENSPSPEKNDTALFVEEDRRMRRRGSQLYVFFSLLYSLLLFRNAIFLPCSQLNFARQLMEII